MDTGFAPAASNGKLYKLADERYRCSRCNYTFHDFSGRWINYGRLSCLQWLSLIKLFELEVSVRKMSLQLGLSYRAVYGAVNTIRMAILSHAEDAQSLLGGEIELDEAYFGGRRKGNRGRGAAGKVPVFGILERGHVHVSVVPDVSAATLLKLTVKRSVEAGAFSTRFLSRYPYFGDGRLQGRHHQEYFARVYITNVSRPRESC